MHSRCYECGGDSVERTEDFHVSHNGSVLKIKDRQMYCASCGAVSYQGEQISEHEKAVADAIRRADGLLTAEELKNVRLKYRLTQADMEKMLSTGPKTWTRWERGKITHSKATDSLLRVFASDATVARCMIIAAKIENPQAMEELDRAQSDAQRIARMAIREGVRQLDVSSGDWIDRVAEIAMSVSREQLCKSLEFDPKEIKVA